MEILPHCLPTWSVHPKTFRAACSLSSNSFDTHGIFSKEVFSGIFLKSASLQHDLDVTPKEARGMYRLKRLPPPSVEVIDSIQNIDTFLLRMDSIQPLTPRERQKRIQAYKKKRIRMNMSSITNKPRYVVRQKFANSRPRIGGRFCNREELNVINKTPALRKLIKNGESVSLKAIAEARAALEKRTRVQEVNL